LSNPGHYCSEAFIGLIQPGRLLLGKQGVVVKTSAPEELGRALRAEYDVLAKVVRAANIKAD